MRDTVRLTFRGLFGFISAILRANQAHRSAPQKPESFDLCLPQIKPEHIGDAVHPGSDGTECAPLPRRHVISARPCSTISECACHDSSTWRRWRSPNTTI